MKSLAALLTLLFLGASCVTNEFPPVRTLPVGQEGHVGSGMVFPETAGSFVRGRRHNYNEDETDISYPYLWKKGADKISITAYAYPVGKTIAIGGQPGSTQVMQAHLLEGHFRGAQNSILNRYPDAELIESGSRGPVSLLGETCTTHDAAYRVQRQAGPFKSDWYTGVLVIGVRQWVLKIRLSGGYDLVHKETERIEEFLQAFLAVNP